MPKTNIPTPRPFNPLDKRQLGESVAKAMLESEVYALPPEPFIGAGIYAIYYAGDFEPYKIMADANQSNDFCWPIYVGKAVPPGARKGGFGLGADPGVALHSRLREHSESVRVVENLDVEDFFCRYLVVDDIWIPLAESMLIEKFSPLWNVVLDGFGNHDPGKGRYEQQRSAWDVLHPGRAWAERLNDNAQTSEAIVAKVESFLSSRL